jgi:hypothetical protein
VTNTTTENTRRRILVGLEALGISVSASCTVPQWRDWRWVMQMSSDRMCYFAESECARKRLERERRLLRALAGQVRCKIPLILAACDDGALRLRRMVLGGQIQNREIEIGTSDGWERIAKTYGGGCCVPPLRHRSERGRDISRTATRKSALSGRAAAPAGRALDSPCGTRPSGPRYP